MADNPFAGFTPLADTPLTPRALREGLSFGRERDLRELAERTPEERNQDFAFEHSSANLHELDDAIARAPNQSVRALLVDERQKLISESPTPTAIQPGEAPGPFAGFTPVNAPAARASTGMPDLSPEALAGSERGWGRFTGDMAVKLGQGVVDLGEAAVGLGDLASFGIVGKALAKIGFDPDRARSMLEGLSSEKQQRLDAVVSQAGHDNNKGWLDNAADTLSTVLQNPAFIPGAVVESLPSMLASGGGARALAQRIYTQAAAKAVAAGASEVEAAVAGKAAVEAATSGLKWATAAGEGAQSSGQIAEQARQQGRSWDEYVLPALAAGAGTAVIGRAAGAVPGFGEAETAAFTGSGAASATGNRLVRTAKGALQEGLLEEAPQSAQEQMFTNIALGKPAGEGVGAAAAQGMVTGAAMGGGEGAFSRAHAVAQTEATRSAGQQALDGATDIDTAIAGATAAATPSPTIVPPPAPAAPAAEASPADDFKARVDAAQEHLKTPGWLASVGKDDPEAKDELLHAMAVARNPRIEQRIRETALSQLEDRIQSIAAARYTPNFTMQPDNGTGMAMTVAPGGSVVPHVAPADFIEGESRRVTEALPAPPRAPRLPGTRTGTMVVGKDGVARPAYEGETRASLALPAPSDALAAGARGVGTPAQHQNADAADRLAAIAQQEANTANGLTPDVQRAQAIRNGEIPAQEPPAGAAANADLLANPEAATGPKTVAGVPVAQHSDDALAAMSRDTAVAPATRHAAAAALAARNNIAGETGENVTPFAEAGATEAQPPESQGEPLVQESGENVPTPEPAATAPRRPRPILPTAHRGKLFTNMKIGDLKLLAQSAAKESTRQAAAAEVARRAAETKPAEHATEAPKYASEAPKSETVAPKNAQPTDENARRGPGFAPAPPVNTTSINSNTVFAGKSGTGMAKFMAGEQQKRLARERPELSWAVEPAPELGHGLYKVVGKEEVPQARKTAEEPTLRPAAADIRKELTDVYGENGIRVLEDAGILRIIDSAYAPEEIRAAMEGGPTWQAAHFEGRAYLFTDALRPGSAPRVLLHEIGEHYGLKGMLGEKAYAGLMRDIRMLKKAGNPVVSKAWEIVKGAYSDPDLGERALAEGSEPFLSEVIAWAGEYQHIGKQNWWKRLVDGVKAWLVKMGFKGVTSDQDVKMLLRASLNKVMRDAARAGEPVEIDGEPAMAAWGETPDTDQRLTGVLSPSKMEGAGAGESVAPQASQQNLADRIDAILRGERTDQPLYLGETPAILQRLGMPALPIGMREQTVDKAHFQHGLLSREMKTLADAIADPVAVVKSESNIAPEDALVVVTDLVKSDGRPVIVAVHSNKLLSKVAVNQVASVYPRERPQQTLPRWFSDLLLYANKEKRPEFESSTGVRFPGKFPKQSDGRKVLLQTDLVKDELRAKWGADPFESGKPRQPPQAKRTFAGLTPEQEAALQNVHGDPVTWQQRIAGWRSGWKQRLTQGLFDQFAPVLDYSKEAYMLSRLSKGGDSTLEALMQYGKLFVRQDGSVGVQYTQQGGLQGFAKPMAELQGEQDRFFEWVAAQRADRLKGLGLENLYSQKDIDALKKLNEGQMPDGSSRKQAYVKALNALNEFNDNVLKLAADSGLIDDATRQMYKGTPYIPFYRLDEDAGKVNGFTVKPGLVNQTAWKKLKGGTQKLNDDLLANVLQNWSHLISAAAKNRAAKATLDAAEAAHAAVQVPNSMPGKGLVSYRENGVEKTYQVFDPYLAEAIGSLTHAGLGDWAKPFQAMKKWLTIGVTANPAFKIRNLIRDSIQAIGTADLSYNPLMNMSRGIKATARESETRAQMLAGGGMLRFGSMLDGNSAEHARRLIESGVDPQYILDSDGKIQGMINRFMKPAWEAYKELGDRGEQINRAALYERLKEKGMSDTEANFMARDLMDFSLQGSWGAVRTLVQVVPFMNARLQGLYKLGRAAKEDWRRMGATLGAVALASIGLLLAYRDDEDWKRREDWDRDNYWWFKVGGHAFRLPKPFEIGAIGTLAERSLELMTDAEMTPQRFAGRISDLVGNQLSMNPMPQLLKPMVDLYANKDSFSGRPIETAAMQTLRPEDRYNDKTSEIAKFLGQMHLPDPSQLPMGRWQSLSPVQIDSLIRGYFSWLGTMTTTAMDYGIRPMVGRGERPDMQLKDVFLAGNFVEALPSGSSRYVTQLYDQAKQVEEAYHSYHDALKRGDTEAARQIAADEKDNLARYKGIEKIKQVEARLNSAIKQVEASTTLSGADKRRLIDTYTAERNRVAETAAGLTTR